MGARITSVEILALRLTLACTFSVLLIWPSVPASADDPAPQAVVKGRVLVLGDQGDLLPLVGVPVLVDAGGGDF